MLLTLFFSFSPSMICKHTHPSLAQPSMPPVPLSSSVWMPPLPQYLQIYPSWEPNTPSVSYLLSSSSLHWTHLQWLEFTALSARHVDVVMVNEVFVLTTNPFPFIAFPNALCRVEMATNLSHVNYPLPQVFSNPILNLGSSPIHARKQHFLSLAFFFFFD